MKETTLINIESLRRKLIAYAHAPIGHAKAGKAGRNYLMDIDDTDHLAENMVDSTMHEFIRILQGERQLDD